jgi:lysophospholipase
VYACDLRGHGKSPGKRGHIDRFSYYLGDADAFLSLVRDMEPERPVFLLGHSLGGLITARLAEEQSLELPGLILSSPFLRLRMPVPPWKRAAASLLSRLAPAMEMPSGLPLEWISHDQAVVEATRKDPLSHQDATPRWFTETLRVQPLAVEAAAAIRSPAALLYAGADRIADPEETERFYAGLSVEKYGRRYNGYYHEIFNEVGREEVFDDLERWLGAHC